MRLTLIWLVALVCSAARAAAPAYKLSGVNFGPYLNGQNPNTNPLIGAETIRALLSAIAPYTTWVRSFGITNGLENFPPIARSMGLKVAAGAWIGSNRTANAAEIQNLIAAANAGNVDVAIVGSEVLLRGDVPETELLGYISQVRQAIPAGIPVATADTFDVLLMHPNVMNAGSVVLANIYPFWQGVAEPAAVCELIRAYDRLTLAAGGRPVIISETGWPTDGQTYGRAVPSLANAGAYLLQFVTWARTRGVQYFAFEAFDEAWKATTGEGQVGAHWGLWDGNLVIKPGMQPVFDGQSSPTSCNGLRPPQDFNADGFPDIAWQGDTSRQVTVHYYTGASFTGWNWLNPSGVPGWHVAAVADFDRDGYPDLVWQNDDTRQVTVHYYMNASFNGWNWLNPAGVPGWHIAAAADFNGDGTPDLVWENDTTRQVTVHYYGGTRGASFTGWSWLNASGVPGWHVTAAANFNGDTVPDLVWQNDTTRQVTVHYYGGTGGASFSGWSWLNASGVPGWHVAAAPDLDGNGTADLLWVDDTTRQATVHFYGGEGGPAMVGWNWVSPTGAPGWSPVR